jgi:hypothetical protein
MKPRITFRVANWRTMNVPRQRDIDSLTQAICDSRTTASRERLQNVTDRRPWNVVRIST